MKRAVGSRDVFPGDPLRLPGFRLPHLRSHFTGLRRPSGALFGGHCLQRPLAADAAACGALLFEELENFGRQSLHSKHILTPLVVSQG
jgi:hypothetical protein